MPKAPKLTFNALFKGTKLKHSVLGVTTYRDDAEGFAFGVQAHDFIAVYDYAGPNDRSFMQLAADAVPEKFSADPVTREGATKACDDVRRDVTLATEAASAASFLAVHRWVSAAQSTDETRYSLNGVCIDRGSMVATDGHRLQLHPDAFPVEIDGKPVPTVILPSAGAQAVANALAFTRSCGAAEYAVGLVYPKAGAWATSMHADPTLTPTHMIFRTESPALAATILVRLVDGQFPDYKQVIPSFALGCLEITGSAKEWRAALEKIPVQLAGGKNKHVRFQFDNEGRVWACDAKWNRDPWPMPARVTGAPYVDAHVERHRKDAAAGKNASHVIPEGCVLELAFNLPYLMDALSGDGPFVARVENELSPLVWTQGDAMAVVMPVRG